MYVSRHFPAAWEACTPYSPGEKGLAQGEYADAV